MFIFKNLFFRISLFCTLVLTNPNNTQEEYLKTLPYKKRFLASSSTYRQDLQEGNKLSEAETTSQSDNNSGNQILEDNISNFTSSSHMENVNSYDKKPKNIQFNSKKRKKYEDDDDYIYPSDKRENAISKKNEKVKSKKSKKYENDEDYICKTKLSKDDSYWKDKKDTRLRSSGKKNENYKSKNLKKQGLQSEDEESDSDFTF